MKSNTFTRLLVLVILLVLTKPVLQGQVFTVIDSLPDGAYGAAAWGDFDNDGFSDLVYIAQGFPSDFFYVYHNSNGVFTAVSQHFPEMYNTSARWADLDNDGFDDLVINGMDSVLHNRTVIYRSHGNGTFTSVDNTIFPLSAGSVDVADYNNDGWKDIAVAGMDSVGINHAYIYKHLGGFVFTDIQAPLHGIHFGEVKWGDYDNDGQSDLVINGIGNSDYRTRVYRNMGNDLFELQPYYMQGSMGTVDWLDYDSDGFADLLVTGVDSTSGQIFTTLHRNNGDGTFSPVATNLPEFGEPSGVATADFDNDGIPDICFTGGSSQFLFTYSAIAMGQGGSAFMVSPFIQGDVLGPIAESADIDNDGDQDLFFDNVILRNDLAPEGVSDRGGDEAVTLFPNPCTTGRFVIRCAVPVEEVVLYDLNGRPVRAIRPAANEAEVETSGLPSGIYIALIRLQGTGPILKKVAVMRM